MTETDINERYVTFTLDMQTEAGSKVWDFIQGLRNTEQAEGLAGFQGNETIRINQIADAMEIEDPDKRSKRIDRILFERNDTSWCVKKAG